MPRDDWFADDNPMETSLVPRNDPFEMGNLPAIPDRNSFGIGPALRPRDQRALDTYEGRRLATIAVSTRLGFARDMAENMIEQMSLGGYLATLNIVYEQMMQASRNQWVYGHFAPVANQAMRMHGNSVLHRIELMRRTFDVMLAEGVDFSNLDERGLLQKIRDYVIGRSD